MKNLIYTTPSYRLAAALVANGHELQGVILSKNLSPKTYVFEGKEDLNKDLDNIEQGKDKIASMDLYTAMDFLTRKITAEVYRQEFLQKVNKVIDSKNG